MPNLFSLPLILFVAFSCQKMDFAKADESAAVTKNIIYPGQKISLNNVSVVDVANCGDCEPGFITSEALVIGKVARKTILPNRLIYPEFLKEPALIGQGEEVAVTLRYGALFISLRGETLVEGRAGESVAVRNRQNGSVVTGIVQPDGTVVVNPS